ncbi:DmX-like protein 1 [Cichlidogyrus casuarinus]|uniref:DmX-like protein 1 n=1 Tax=Cichlidogyrus casuarinus TaxID=1844966 RepID=A0ABD2Q5V5_9PLAT
MINISERSSLTGHCFDTHLLRAHPLASLILSSSHSPSRDGSELLLWSFEPVGPLSTGVELTSSMQNSIGSGLKMFSGLSEIARLQTDRFAFEQIAWFPTLVPTSLDACTESQQGVAPSYDPLVLFVTNVEEELRLFVAFSATQRGFLNAELAALRSNNGGRLISLKHSGTSGLVIQLSSQLHISDPDSENLLLHVFPGDMIGCPSSQESLKTFFITRVSRSRNKVASSPARDIDRRLIDPAKPNISSRVVQVEVAASYFNWLTNVCPPYVFATSHQNGQVLFWACEKTETGVSLREWRMPLQLHGSSRINVNMVTTTRPMLLSQKQRQLTEQQSTTEQEHGGFERAEFARVLHFASAHTGRLAVAFISPLAGEKCTEEKFNSIWFPDARLQVAIYECDSTGGCEWMLEDTIDLSIEIEKCLYYRNLITEQQRQSFFERFPPKEPNNAIRLDWVSTEDGCFLLSVFLFEQALIVFAPSCREITMAQARPFSVPTSPSHPTGQTKPSYEAASGKSALVVSIGPAAGSTLIASLGEVGICWIRLSKVIISSELNSRLDQMHGSDRISALWLKNGLIVLGLRSEIQVISQWPSEMHSGQAQMDRNLFIKFTWFLDKSSPRYFFATKANICDIGIVDSDINTSVVPESLPAKPDEPVEMEEDRKASLSCSLTAARLTKTYSAYNLTKNSHIDLSSTVMNRAPISRISPKQSDRPPAPHSDKHILTIHNVDLGVPQDFIASVGLFEAVYLVHPVLPQFHPRQLLEWMNLGKLRRVQAILVHLTRCLIAIQYGGMEPAEEADNPGEKGKRRKSIYVEESKNESTKKHAFTTQSELEIQSIPPLPLYVLTAIDSIMNNGSMDISSRHASVTGPSNRKNKQNQNDDLFLVTSNDLDLNLEDDTLLDDLGEESEDVFHGTKESEQDSAKQALAYYESLALTSRQHTANTRLLRPAALYGLLKFTSHHLKSLSEL